MASIRKEIRTQAGQDAVWDVIRDIGAVHTRLAPGVVTDTKLEPGARIVTFANGLVVREPIVTLDEVGKRLVWTAEGARTTHFYASMEVLADRDRGSRLVWTADFLPDEAGEVIGSLMEAGAAVIRKSLDGLARPQ